MIGNKFYKYDGNKRVYTDLETGVKSSSPIFKYSFREFYVIGETKISWLLSPYADTKPDSHLVVKVKKNTNLTEAGYLTEAEKLAAIWVEENSYRIYEKVRGIKNPEILKQIEKLIND